MTYTILDDLIFYQIITFNKKYSNFELKLHKYFFDKTKGINPAFIVVIEQFIFFFVKNKDYFASKVYLDSMRREIVNKKILIIRTENVLINLLFGLFPDLYIHDLSVELEFSSKKREISVYFLTFRDRGIAIGRGGNYISTVNVLLKKYIVFENSNKTIEIRCKTINNKFKPF
ncbi:MAG: hypothetical protein ACXABO_01510 [Promethearchaeota archaeon]